eukprot:65464-Amphidinium_carterae.1
MEIEAGQRQVAMIRKDLGLGCQSNGLAVSQSDCNRVDCQVAASGVMTPVLWHHWCIHDARRSLPKPKGEINMASAVALSLGES